MGDHLQEAFYNPISWELNFALDMYNSKMQCLFVAYIVNPLKVTTVPSVFNKKPRRGSCSAILKTTISDGVGINKRQLQLCTPQIQVGLIIIQ